MPSKTSHDNLISNKLRLQYTSFCKVSTDVMAISNRFLVGLNGAGVLYYFFRSKDGIACVATKYFTQWHLVSLNCIRDKS